MSRWVSITLTVASILVTIAGIATYVIKNRQLGTKFEVSANEAVNYSGDATEADCKLLAGLLKEQGFFDGTKTADVLLSKGAEGIAVSFVLSDGWDDEQIVEEFTIVGEKCAAAFEIKPFKVSLLSTQLNNMKDLPITQRRLQVSPQEQVVFTDSTSLADAKLLAEALKQADYFDNSAPAIVRLSTGAEGTAVSFALQEGKWDDAAVLRGLTTLGEKCAAPFGPQSFKVRLLDTNLNQKKELPITQRRLLASPEEQIVFSSPITLAQAQALAEALKQAGYFDASAPAIVRLSKTDKGHSLGFVVGDGAWEKPNVITELEGVARKVADSVGKPLSIEFLDNEMVVKKTIPLE